jgi:peptide/nickel transport system substrate-binding protein
MEAFERYYKGAPKIGRVTWRAYPTVRTAWAAMMRGEVDFLYEVGHETREFIEGESSVAVFSFLRNYVYAIGLNIKRPAFRDSRIRQALNYAVNREDLVEQAFKGHGIPASGGTWPQHWAYNPSVSGYSLDADRASALLDAAGVPKETRASPNSAPGRLHFTCLVPEGFPLWEKVSLLVQRDFSRIGIHMTLEALPVKEFNARIISGDFDAFVSELIVGNSPSRPFTFWHSTSKQNLWGYSNKSVDDAFAGIRGSQNEVEYRQAFGTLQAALVQDPPAVFLALGENSRAVSRRFVVVAPQGSDILPTIADWGLGLDSESSN